MTPGSREKLELLREWKKNLRELQQDENRENITLITTATLETLLVFMQESPFGTNCIQWWEAIGNAVGVRR